MRRTPAVLASMSLLLGAALVTGCTGGGDPEPAQVAPTTPAPAAPLSLSLLVFNVEYGGTPATDAVLADIDADVVGVLESYNRLPEIAAGPAIPTTTSGSRSCRSTRSSSRRGRRPLRLPRGPPG